MPYHWQDMSHTQPASFLDVIALMIQVAVIYGIFLFGLKTAAVKFCPVTGLQDSAILLLVIETVAVSLILFEAL